MSCNIAPTRRRFSQTPKIQICANDEAKYLHDANADNDLYIWIKFHAIKSKLNHSIGTDGILFAGAPPSTPRGRNHAVTNDISWSTANNWLCNVQFMRHRTESNQIDRKHIDSLCEHELGERRWVR